MIGAITENDSLALISRPIVIPAIYFFYVSARLRKPDVSALWFFLLNFIGDTIILLQFKNSILYIMVPYFLSYLVLIRFAILDIRKITFSKYGAVVGMLLFALFTSFVFVLTQFFTSEQSRLVGPILVYGTVLAFYVGLTGYYFYVSSSKAAFFMLMASLTLIISDIFYAMFNLLQLFPVFSYLNTALQLLAYYFVAQYFILRKY